MDDFYQACIAENIGVYIDNPFTNNSSGEKLEVDENNLEI